MSHPTTGIILLIVKFNNSPSLPTSLQSTATNHRQHNANHTLFSTHHEKQSYLLQEARLR